jgi:hypothetical protein
MTLGISGITVRRQSQAFFDSIDPTATLAASDGPAVEIGFSHYRSTGLNR